MHVRNAPIALDAHQTTRKECPCVSERCALITCRIGDKEDGEDRGRASEGAAGSEQEGLEKHKARKDRGRRKKKPAGKQSERVRLRRREGRWATGMVQKRKARARKATRGA